MSSFIFLGGDLRMLYAAEYLNKTFDCFVYGFENAEEFPVPAAGELMPCDFAALPLPAAADGAHITMPYHSENPDLDIILKAVKQGGSVFTGKSCPYLERICEENGLKLYDYFDREELQLMNAVPTAEGALEIMLKELPVTVFGTNTLITGFGRIGEVMARMLISLGARVSVYARRSEQLAKAECMGCAPVSEKELEHSLNGYDVIINTVPATVLDRWRLLLLKKDCLIIDLASKSGVEDPKLAESVGVRVIHALSLPGRTAPVSAGRIIGKTIENILET
ncbi:MAG: hypothetical protein NC394_09740 [Bacteroides sp.]|nr:hypothetical protein [Bacteroides sp.]